MLSFDGNLIDEYVNRMYLHVIENFFKVIEIQRHRNDKDEVSRSIHRFCEAKSRTHVGMKKERHV